MQSAEQSSQWDGFRHYSQPMNPGDPSSSKERVFYGGTTKEEIMDSSNHRIGIHHWSPQGIAGMDIDTPSSSYMTDSSKGRGILLDYARWATSQTPPISYSTFSTHSIPLSTLKAVCRDQGVTPRKGDILFIRTGVIPEWNAFSDQRKQEYAAQSAPEHAGVEASIDLLEWLWDSGISAVAGDAISWEVSIDPSPH